MQNRTLTVCAIVLAGASAAFFYSGTTRSESQPLLDWQDPVVVARGDTIYAAQCASCHGPIGAHSTPATPAEWSAPSHDAGGHTWEHPDFALVQLTKTGEVAELCKDVSGSDMPEFSQALTDREIVDVLSYIKSTWPEDIRKQHDDINAIYKGQNDAVRDLLDLSGS